MLKTSKKAIGGGAKTKLQSSQICVEKSKNFFKPIVATSLALALGASVASAQVCTGSGDNGSYWCANGSTSENYAAITKNGIADPWSGTISSDNPNANLGLSGRIGSDFTLKGLNTQITIDQSRSFSFSKTGTLELTNSYLKFADKPQSNGEHFLRAQDNGAKLTATFTGGRGSETINGVTYNNVAFYGGMHFYSRQENTANFKGANLIGQIEVVGRKASSKATLTFTGGGNLIATDKDHFLFNREDANIKGKVIKMSRTGDASGLDVTLNITFGKSDQKEYADGNLLDKDGVVIGKLTDGSITYNEGSGKKLITNALKGEIDIAGYGASKAQLTLNFYNNGLIEGPILLRSTSIMDIYFANKGTIRSHLNFVAGGDGTIGTLKIAKSEGEPRVDDLTIEGSINNSGLSDFVVTADKFLMDGGLTTGSQANKLTFDTYTAEFKNFAMNNGGMIDIKATTSLTMANEGSKTLTNTGTLNITLANTTNNGHSEVGKITFNDLHNTNNGNITLKLDQGSTDLSLKGIYNNGKYNTAPTITLDLRGGMQADYLASVRNQGSELSPTATFNVNVLDNKNFTLSALNLQDGKLVGVSRDQESSLITPNTQGNIVLVADASASSDGARKGANNTIKVTFDSTSGKNSHVNIIGDIYSLRGSNNVTLTDNSNTSNTEAEFIGNIYTSGGNTNLVFNDTLWAPTNIAELAGKVTFSSKNVETAKKNIMDYISKYGTGTVTTTAGNTNIAVNLDQAINFGTQTAMYNVITTGGTSNIALKGQANLGANVKYGKTGKTTFIFANTAETLSNGAGQIDQNQLLGNTYKDGVKLVLQDKDVSLADGSSQSFLTLAGVGEADYALSFTTNRTKTQDTISLRGVAVGELSNLDHTASVSSRTYTVTLEQDAIFAGNVALYGNGQVIDVTMRQGSKLFFDNEALNLENLTLSGAIHDTTTILQNSFKQNNTVIDLATDGNDFANIKSRTDFRVLVIGDKNNRDGRSVKGLTGNNGLFRVYVNPQATGGKLGGTSVSNAFENSKVYSDRIIINNGTAGNHYIQAIYDADTDISQVSYKKGSGSETEGNIAVATVASDTGITFKGAQQIQGFDLIETTLSDAIKTNADGTYNTNGAYNTYFIEMIDSIGVSQADAQATAVALGVNYDLFIANFNSLNKRMGELRDNAHSHGAWGRVFNGMLSTNYALQTKSIYTTVQAGYDYAFGGEGFNNYVGFALSYLNAITDSTTAIDIDNQAKGLGQSTSHGVEVALYNSYVGDGVNASELDSSNWASGFYNDTIFKFSYATTNLNILAQSNNYDTNNFGIVLSDEVGYRFKLGSNGEWNIDPQAEIGFGYFNETNLKQTLGEASLDGIQDAIITLRARVGASWGYDFKNFTEGKDVNAKLYVGTFYSYDIINGGDINLTTNLNKSTSLKVLGSTGRFDLNVGTNLEIKDNTRLYFDFERSFGGNITTEYQVNLGVRYSFGEANGYTPIKPKDELEKKLENKAPLKVENKGEKKEEAKTEAN